ncbi:MFS transporter [Streptomyces sp. NPDC048111]|uniref:MFS transporter n=1 Tax=Streptomyces sp. NPDC048111 TaxID=3365500 RepID=UPI00370FB33B
MSRTDTRVDIARPGWFWTGVVLSCAGVLLHLPMYFAMRARDHDMAGMDMSGSAMSGHPMPGSGMDGMGAGSSAAMVAGMVLLVVGLVAAVYGLVRHRPSDEAASRAGRYRVVPGPQDRLSPAHRRLIAAISLALIIDVMKPATLAFIIPGMREEYGISAPEAAWLPVGALAGTIIGSIVWGWLADRLGRRATILLSSLMFITTTVCAVMPTFAWNIVMCVGMGAAAGGLLPVAYALMAESMPTRQRSVIMVLQAGLATVAAYFFTSALAALMIPVFGWRVMWLVHFPFAVAIVLVNRWIPESPRFLLRYGRITEAERIVADYRMVLVDDGLPAGPDGAPADATGPGGGGAARPVSGAPAPQAKEGALAALFGRRMLVKSLVVGAYALSWSVVNWGFMTFLPTLMGKAAGGRVLPLSSLLAIPGTALVAYLYARWSSRRTMVLSGAVTVLALLALAALGRADAGLGSYLPLALLLVGTSGVIATLAPYAAEIYPTDVRGAAGGYVAACSKTGGLFAPPLIGLLLAHYPGMRVIALCAAAPMALATLAIALKGRETAGRDLEEVRAEPPVAVSRAADGLAEPAGIA